MHQFLINDSIVVWRTWILFPQHRTVKSILAISLLACCGKSESWALLKLHWVLMIAGTIFDAASGAVNVLRNVAAPGAKSKEFLVLDLSLLFTNITATSLVAYKAWWVLSVWKLRDTKHIKHDHYIGTIAMNLNAASVTVGQEGSKFRRYSYY